MATAKPLVPWMGGKRKLAKHLIPRLPDHTCYVEPFAGAGAIYFMKHPSKVEVLNDLNGDITNLYRVVKHHFTELYKQFEWVLTSRENWEKLKITPPETMTDIQRAARFLYLQKLCFGGKPDGRVFGTGTTAKPRFNLISLEHDLQEAHFRLANTMIEHLDWKAVIKKYDRAHTLFYCDPPYWKVSGYGAPFKWEEYEALAEFGKNIKGKMLISLNNHHDIKGLFSDYDVTEIDYTYTTGKAEHRNKKAVELVLEYRS